MPLGEAIAEIGIRLILEPALYAAGYGTGYVVLSLCSLGKLELASWTTIGERQRLKKKDRQWSFVFGIWRRSKGGGRQLTAEVVTCTGIVFWILVGIAIALLAGGGGSGG